MLLDVTRYTEPLSRTPAHLRAVIEGQPDAWLDRRHSAEAVSPRETVAHLILCDRLSWLPRAQRILKPEEEVPRDPSADLEEVDLLAVNSVYDLLAEFETLRSQKIQELTDMGLVAEDLEKQGDHPKFGTYTVGQLLATWVAHDLYHLGQVFKAYSMPYVEQIGPWQHYLNLPQFN